MVARASVPETLHREGCEFGRQTRLELEHIVEDLGEIKLRTRNIEEKLDALKVQSVRQDTITRGGTWLVAAIVSGAIGALFRWVGK